MVEPVHRHTGLLWHVSLRCQMARAGDQKPAPPDLSSRVVMYAHAVTVLNAPCQHYWVLHLVCLPLCRGKVPGRLQAIYRNETVPNWQGQCKLHA